MLFQKAFMENRIAKYIMLTCFVFAVFFVSGCRTLKAPKSPTNQWSPPKWEKTTKTPDNVWKLIRQENVNPDELFTLAELMDIAFVNSPVIRDAYEAARAREAEVKQAQSEYYPQGTISGDLTREKKVATLRVENTNNHNYSPKAVLSFLVLDLGGRDAAVREATQNVLSANFEFNQTIQNLIYNTAKAYYDFYSAEEDLKAKKADVKDASTTLDAAERKFKSGLVSKLDMLQAKSNYEESLYFLEGAKGQVFTTRGSLAEVCGLSADVPIEIAPPDKNFARKITSRDVSDLIDEALKTRPDIAAARSDLRARQEAIKVANSNLWPTLNVTGSAEKRWYRYTGDEERNWQYCDYVGYFSFDWDIFDGFDKYSKRLEAQAEMRQETEKLKQTELAASSDVWTKYYRLKTAVKKLIFSEAFLASSLASHELALDGYKVGLKSILDLLEAQSQLQEARSKLVASQKDVFVSTVGLARAMGLLARESFE